LYLDEVFFNLLRYEFIYRISLFDYLLHVPSTLLRDIDSTLQSFLHDFVKAKF